MQVPFYIIEFVIKYAYNNDSHGSDGVHRKARMAPLIHSKYTHRGFEVSRGCVHANAPLAVRRGAPMARRLPITIRSETKCRARPVDAIEDEGVVDRHVLL